MLQSLQAGRGIAALLVVLFHLNGSIWGQPKYFPQPFSAAFGFGNAGVQFFFVLSGFIIFYAHRADLGRPAALGDYLSRRFIRIFPAYWLVLVPLIPAYVALHHLEWQDELWHIVTSTLLLPYPTDPVLQVAWTLRHEVLFYALFAVCIANLRWGIALLIAWQGGCAAALVLTTSGYLDGFLLSANNILFLLGSGVAWLSVRYRVRHPGLLLGAGLVAFLATGWCSVDAPERLGTSARVLMFGAASAAMIAGLVALEREGRFVVPWPLRHLGDASYAVYLVHFPVLSAAAKLAFASGLDHALPEPLTFAIFLGLALAAGSGFHLLIERPVMMWLRSSRRPAPA